MELGILIFRQILSMFLMILVGFLLVKFKIVKNDLGLYLAKIAIYVVLPCTIVNSFIIKRNADTINEMIFAFSVALISNVLLILLSKIFRIVFKYNEIEQATIAYPNSGDILISLVSSVISPDMTIYCCAFMVIQILFMFTYGIKLLTGYRTNSKWIILKNPNFIAIILGIIMFTFNIKIPYIVSSAMNSFSGMIAPISMLIIGCSIANSNFISKLNNKNIYCVVLIRQIIIPLIYLIIVKVLNLKYFIYGADKILLIIYMAICSSPATTIVNIVQNYNGDVEYASVINLIGVSLLIITLPVMIFVYLMFI